MPNFICHIEICTTDLKKSEEFYRKIFNWKIKSADFPDYSSFETEKEPGGGLMKVDKINPGEGVTVYVLVDDVDKTLSLAKKSGGKIIKEKTEIPNIGWYGLFSDLDGNILGVFKGK
jgi:hypothetical protein